MMRLAGVTLLVALTLAAPASAAPTLERLGTFIQPTWVGAAPGDKGRVFVAERSGRISTITGSAVATYMDISGTVLSTTSERGLLSVAFAADFATSQKLYVYGRKGRPCPRCGTPVRKADQGEAGRERPTYWCPRCQTGPTS